MEQKIREYLNSIGCKQLNLASEYAREQILSDIMRIVKGELAISEIKQSIIDAVMYDPSKKCNCGKPYDYTEIDRS